MAAAVAALAKSTPEYRFDGYMLIFESLAYAHRTNGSGGHLSAAELVAALIGYARHEYGPLAAAVLAEWGVRTPADVGKLVYLLIGAELLAASPEDAPEDFDRIAGWFEPEPWSERTTAHLPTID